MLRPFTHPVACCWMLLRVDAQCLKPGKLFSQQLPTFLLFRDRRSVAQQCWIRLHSSSNIVKATHAHYAWFKKTYGKYPSHDALQVPELLGVVASVCTPLPTRTQQCVNNVGSCCVHLHEALHLIFFTRKDSHVIPLFVNSDVLTVDLLYVHNVSKVMLDVVSSKTAPGSILHLFSNTSNVHSHQTKPRLFKRWIALSKA